MEISLFLLRRRLRLLIVFVVVTRPGLTDKIVRRSFAFAVRVRLRYL